jgi:hypothetical protein
MKENLELNLQVLSREYRKGRPQKGFALLDELISENNSQRLRRLLRDHREDPITSSRDVEQRDQVDYLLGYYSLLEVARIAGYVPGNLNQRLRQEMKFILDNSYVKTYYTDYYKLHLPEIAYKRAERNMEVNHNDNLGEVVCFENFLLLQNTYNDEDIEQFLWFLDDGITNGYSIRDLQAVLKDRSRLKRELETEDGDILNSALWGFIKYTQFLIDYKKLLVEADGHPELQSAFWHHQSYWFWHLKKKVGKVIGQALTNIKESVSNSDNMQDLVNDTDSVIEDGDDYKVWKESASGLDEVEQALTYLTNPKLAEPIVMLNKSLN